MRNILMGLIVLGFCASVFAASAVGSAIKGAKIEGSLRAHYNVRDYETQPTASALAVGGGLRIETGSLGWTKFGAGFYTAQDLGVNSKDPEKVDGRMGSDMEVLGEAYVNFAAWDSSMTLGRQKIVTPFATPLDIFLAPFTFEGLSWKYTGIDNLALELDYINTIKAAGSDEFVDVGVWSTNRLGVETTATSGTLMVGANYAKEAVSLQAWHYTFADLYDAQYLQAAYNFTERGFFKPFIAAQFITQHESGDALLGKVDSKLLGAQVGSSYNNAKFLVGYTHVAEQEDSFKNGAFLAPYSFASSPLYTNNMIQSMENMDAGESMKLTFFYYFPHVELKLSHAHFDYKMLTDRDASCVDVTYNLSHHLKGLSLRYRLEVVTSDIDEVEQSDQRLQLQYVF